ncbi:terpene cyclase/mutase family protein [soil metagenome]
MTPKLTPLTRRRFVKRGLGTLGALVIAGRVVRSQEADREIEERMNAVSARAVNFLRPRQETKGGWSTEHSPGITALVVAALLSSNWVPPADPIVSRGLDYLEGLIGPNGGIGEGPYGNYITSIGLVAFQAAQEKRPRGRYAAIIKAGQNYLKGIQWDEDEDRTRDDPFFGGAGYGGHSRPDLSNTSFFIEALRETGVPPDDPALQKALIFVSRAQNLDSEFNDQPWADQVNDGGFIYTPARGGESFAGEAPGGGLRSYGSMTYAGLKSMVYAGLGLDDPRVKAAYDFIRAHYTLDENPGMGEQGLYYYYLTFAKALAALGQPTLTDTEGTVHDWRADLVAALTRRQGPQGEWVNPADRWMEGDPNLVTAYGLLALAAARDMKPTL